MAFSIPKGVKKEHLSQQFSLLLPILPSDMDPDRMISSLIELCLFHGYRSMSKTDTSVGSDNKSSTSGFERYLSNLLDSGKMTGLSEQQRREVVESWIKSTVVQIGRGGLKRQTGKMDYPKPLTAVTYRSGLPKSPARNRGADTLVYAALKDEFRRRGATNVASQVATLIRESLSSGIEPGVKANYPPTIVNEDDVDISSLLSVWFFEGFPEIQDGGTSRKHKDPFISVPGAVAPIGRDLLNLLNNFAPSMSPTENIAHLTALIAFRMFQLPLRTAVAVRELFETGTLAEDFLKPASRNPLEIYCDFTERRLSPSDMLSKACVRRDLEVMRRSLHDRVVLRTLHLANLDSDLVRSPKLGDSSDIEGDRIAYELQLPTYFRELALNRDAKEIEIAIRIQMRALIEQAKENGDEEAAMFMRETLAAEPPLAAMGIVLTEGLQDDAVTNGGKWFWSTGGLNKSYGILFGSAKKVTWKYRMSDDLLISLLLAAFAGQEGGKARGQMPVKQLLSIFKNDFGVLIAEPPSAFDDATNRGAAVDNREAFVRRLQLLGVFRGLSDDFGAQDVSCPRNLAGGVRS